MKHIPVVTAALVAGSTAVLLATGGPAAADFEEVRVGLAAEPTSMDPHYHNLTPNNAFARNVFDRLINPDETQALQPGLAVSWEPIDDDTWEFRLREGVTFHDGSEFNADDVIFTMSRAENVPNSPSSFALYTKGKEFEKVDDYTVHVHTDGPQPLVPNDLMNVSIISGNVGEDVSTRDFNDGMAMIGTGPYRFVEWVPGDRIVLEANDDYWGDAPEFERVVIRPISSNPTRVAALLSGDVDFIDSVPTTDVERLRGMDDINLVQGVSNRVIYLHMDQFRDDSPHVETHDGSNPLKDARVRKAISHAINRDAIVDRVMEGLAIPAGQLVPPEHGFLGASPDLEPDAYDPDRAKELLAEAGYPDGFALTVHGPSDRYVNDARIVQAIGQMLTRVGLRTTIDTMPMNVYFREATRGSPGGEPGFSLFLFGWGTGTGETSSPLRSLLMSWNPEKGQGASNRGRYSNNRVDELIEQAMRTVDDGEREKLLQRASEIAIGEDQGIIPLHYQVNTWATREGLEYTPRTDEQTVLISLHRAGE